MVEKKKIVKIQNSKREEKNGDYARVIDRLWECPQSSVIKIQNVGKQTNWMLRLYYVKGMHMKKT